MEPPPSPIIYDVLLIAFSIVAVAILSGAESSFIAVNKIRIRGLIDKGDPNALAVQKILDQHDRLFSVVILSGNLFTVLATSVCTALALKSFGPDMGIVVSTVIITFLTVVFGELAPKTFAVTYADKLSLLLARPMQVYIKLVSPLVWIFHKASTLILKLFGVSERPASPFVTEEEIRTMINIGEEEGSIEAKEKKLLHMVFEFGDKEVSEVMVPRTEIVSVESTATASDVLKLVAKDGYSRYPVIAENIDAIQGILYVKDILIAMSETGVEKVMALPVTHFMRDAFYIPENKMVTKLLDDMQKKKFHIAVVVDEYGGTAGLITLEDIMEEIVGGLQDEFESMEAERDIEVIDEHTFVVSGQTDIDEISELVGVELKTEDFNTIGGYVFGLFGRLPRIGEQVRAHDLKFLVMEMVDRKITKIKITRL